MDSLTATGIGMNVAYLIGHNSVRRSVLGMAARAPTMEELLVTGGRLNAALLGALGAARSLG